MARPPIYACSQFHIICASCKPGLLETKCPECRWRNILLSPHIANMKMQLSQWRGQQEQKKLCFQEELWKAGSREKPIARERLGGTAEVDRETGKASEQGLKRSFWFFFFNKAFMYCTYHYQLPGKIVNLSSKRQTEGARTFNMKLHYYTSTEFA